MRLKNEFNYILNSFFILFKIIISISFNDLVLVNHAACLCHHPQKNSAILEISYLGVDLKLVLTKFHSIS